MSETYSGNSEGQRRTDTDKYIDETRMVGQDLDLHTPDLSPENKQMVSHMIALYRDNPNPGAKDEVIERINLMIQKEPDENEKESLRVALGLFTEDREL